MTMHHPSDDQERTDLHNSEIDETLAADHRCGMRNLATGAECHLSARHAGGCQFVRDTIDTTDHA